MMRWMSRLESRPHVLGAERRLELGERAERQAEAERLAVEPRLDLAAVGICHRAVSRILKRR
jgi:hypothetical protein